MTEFLGVKHKHAERLDIIRCGAENCNISVQLIGGLYGERAVSTVSAETARSIAAELIKLADQIEGGRDRIADLEAQLAAADAMADAVRNNTNVISYGDDKMVIDTKLNRAHAAYRAIRGGGNG